MSKRPAPLLIMRSQYLPLLLGWLRARGAGEHADALIAEFALPPPIDIAGVPEIRVPLDVHRAISERAAERIGDPLVGMHVAVESPRGAYGVMEFVGRSTPTLAEAGERAIRYMRLLSDIIVVGIELCADGYAVVHSIPGEPLCAGRHGNEFALVTMMRFARELSGKAIVASEVQFAHPAPADVSEIVAFFGTSSVRFGMSVNRLVFSREVFAHPVMTGDDALLPLLERHAKMVLPPLEEGTGQLTGIRQQIRVLLQQGRPATVAELASDLRVSTRTLQRRLSDAKSSFQTELDAVRNELANIYLEDPALSMYAIAQLLGYSDQSAFERAFRRWRRITPSRYRQQRQTDGR